MTITADDIHAFPAAAETPGPPQPPRRRAVWPWVLLGLLTLVLSAAMVGTAALITLAESAGEGVQVTINGERWDGISLEPGHWPLAFAGIVTTLLVVLVAVPCTVLLALASAALGVGIALLAVLAVAAVALSPLWLPVLLLWLLLRRRDPPAATMRG